MLWSIFSLIYVAVATSDFRFVPLPSDIDAHKCNSQTLKIHKETLVLFESKNHKAAIEEIWRHEVFMLVNRQGPVAFMKIRRTVGYEPKKTSSLFSRPKYHQLLIIYSFYVKEEYRRKGLGAMLMKKAIEYTVRRYNMPSDTLLMLHLAALGPPLSIAMRMYYKIGFCSGVLSLEDPYMTRCKLDKLLWRAEDIYELARNSPDDLNGKGCFIVAHCPLSRFGKGRNPPEDAQDLEESLYHRLRNSYIHREEQNKAKAKSEVNK